MITQKLARIAVTALVLACIFSINIPESSSQELSHAPVATEFQQTLSLTDVRAGVSIGGRFISYERDLFSERLVRQQAQQALSSAHTSTQLSARPRSTYRRPSRLWRIVGGIAGGFSGFTLYGPRAISDSRINVSETQRLAEWSVVTASVAYLGYLIGKSVDQGK